MLMAQGAEVGPGPAFAAGRQRDNVVDFGRQQFATVVFADRVGAEFGGA
jgi:hypothetical protein